MIFQFRQGDSWFHRIDPISKFVWLSCVSVLSLWYEEAAIQGTLFIAVVLFGMFCCKFTPALIWKMLRIPFWFSIPYFILQLLFVPGETVLIQYGVLTVTTESLDFAAAITLRLLTLILASLLLVITTDPRDVVLALTQKLRVPYRFAFAISIALRFLPILQSEAEVIRAAHKRRGLQLNGAADHMHWWFAFVKAIFISAFRRVQQLAEAMEVRGFGTYPDRTYVHTLSLAPSGIFFAVICSCLLIVILYFIG